MYIMAAILLALPLVFFAEPVRAFAAYGSWVRNGASSPYGSFSGTTNNLNLNEPGSNTIDTLLGQLIYALGKGLSELLNMAGFSLDKVIMGRVATGAGTTNLFAFELSEGNIYGVLGAKVFVLLRGIVWVMVAFYFVGNIAKQGFVISPKKRDEYKDMFLNVFLFVAFLILWPQIADALIYIRDVVLQAEAKTLFGNSASFDIAGAFAENYDQNKNTINALMFLAVQGVTVYLGFAYVSIAISQTIIFLATPIIVVLSMKDKSLLTSATRMFVGNLLIPIVDLIVLFVPLQISSGSSSAETYIITLIACLCVPVARNMIRQLFGMGHAGGMESLGLGALAAMGAAGMAGLRKGKDGAGSIADMAKQKKKDKDKAYQSSCLSHWKDSCIYPQYQQVLILPQLYPYPSSSVLPYQQ